jgi:hypothetical protein
MKKRYLLTGALIAAALTAALVFTACEDTDERLMTFTNNSDYVIHINAPGSSPNSFDLPKFDETTSKGGTKTVTRTGKDIEFEWTVPSQGGDKELWATMEKDGSTVTFKKGTGANIRLVE